MCRLDTRRTQREEIDPSLAPEVGVDVRSRADAASCQGLWNPAKPRGVKRRETGMLGERALIFLCSREPDTPEANGVSVSYPPPNGLLPHVFQALEGVVEENLLLIGHLDAEKHHPLGIPQVLFNPRSLLKKHIASA